MSDTTTETAKKGEGLPNKGGRTRIILIGGGVILVLALGALAYYFFDVAPYVSIETSAVNAPEIDLAPTVAGPLQEMLVNEGDTVQANQAVARVGDQLIKTQVAGIITSTDDALGQNFAAGQTVVTMIDPTQLRIVGELDEDKGLDDVQVGDKARFTVDAFGGESFYGTVDSISEEPHQNDVVFDISDKRQVQQFDVKVAYDVSEYPQFKDGMSARIWVYKNTSNQ